MVIHGLEAPGEAPYAAVEHLRVRLQRAGSSGARASCCAIWRFPGPRLHLIVYPDGSTNQPQPRKPRKAGKPALDTLFDLKAGHVSVEQGVLDYENRAAAFDFQNRYIAAGLRRQRCFPAHELRARRRADIRRATASRPEPAIWTLRGASRAARSEPAHGRMQATLDLTRNAAYLRSLRLTASMRPSRHSRSPATLEDFAHPRWQAKAAGDLDMRLLDPITGYPFAPEGIARLDLESAPGEAGQFRIDGSVHIDEAPTSEPASRPRAFGWMRGSMPTRSSC